MSAAPIRHQSEATREFEAVRAAVFPDWDEGEHWTLVLGHHPDYPGQAGLCVPLSRMIYVAPTRTRLKWRQVMVHEICHAIAGSDHGEEFRTKLAGAARRARSEGDAELADAIESEIASSDRR